jgi:hypothetical protein
VTEDPQIALNWMQKGHPMITTKRIDN